MARRLRGSSDPLRARKVRIWLVLGSWESLRSTTILTARAVFVQRLSAAGFRRWGSSSSMRLAGFVGRRPKTSFRYAYGLWPFMRAECTRLITAAACWGRIWFSTQLLSMGRSPSSM